MRNYDNSSPSMSPDSPLDSPTEQIKQRDRKREVHQRLERINEERQLKRLLSDEWDD